MGSVIDLQEYISVLIEALKVVNHRVVSIGLADVYRGESIFVLDRRVRSCLIEDVA